ncbi:MAG: hypothetical protein UU32_C0040G0005 [Candidatus Woesebacteria bacterium GW2011_GWB1_41_10]|uniref:Uncharacterized protein n=2 Tax=Microgenomates group TaxID=1794810 RepID=A0A0G0UCR8_9BACT|nr:MAG: hypothetical protein UT84_C0052G0005 [Candidatus Curtissbacteria bacterium GW2011_GWA1_40_16]KKR85102.1 MAG: hypothetical protein UU32_C0040G0005 [Candidatus Woesebacteria bacterium GW2011_GWB1_41_10]
MFSPEVRSHLPPYDAAYDYLLDAISQLEEELDIEGNIQAAKKIKDSLEEYNHMLDTLTHDNNIPLVASFLEDQAEELFATMTDPENTEKIQGLQHLAASLSRAA